MFRDLVASGAGRMTATQPVVLVLDDEKNIRSAIDIALRHEGMNVIQAHDVAAARRMLHERIVDVMIVDIRLGDVSGLDFFRAIQAEDLAPPTMFISGHATLTEAAQAVKLGGFDFLEKPFSAEKIVVSVRRCLEFVHAHANASARAGCTRHRDHRRARPPSGDWWHDAIKVAHTNASVLITGESGTGKELVANCIHANSERAAAAVREGELLRDSREPARERAVRARARRLHRRGGGARGCSKWRIGGVIFLDEIGDLSPSAQAKILRVLQRRRAPARRRGDTTRWMCACFRHPQGPKQSRGRGALPRRPFLPPERRARSRAARCASGGKTSRCSWPSLLAPLREQQHARKAHR